MVTITQTRAQVGPVTAPTIPTHELPQPNIPSTPSEAPAVSVLAITDACWQRIRELNHNNTNALQAKDNDTTAHNNNNNSSHPKFLRVVVDAGGCSGFSYQFQLDDTIDDDDYVVEYQADRDHDTTITTTTPAKVVVDPDSLALISGSTIDYESTMMKAAFRVMANPQSESACGCGSSFAVKKFALDPALD
jgi:iron-sulfur cluster assembly accessory protein